MTTLLTSPATATDIDYTSTLPEYVKRIMARAPLLATFLPRGRDMALGQGATVSAGDVLGAGEVRVLNHADPKSVWRTPAGQGEQFLEDGYIDGMRCVTELGNGQRKLPLVLASGAAGDAINQTVTGGTIVSVMKIDGESLGRMYGMGNVTADVSGGPRDVDPWDWYMRINGNADAIRHNLGESGGFTLVMAQCFNSMTGRARSMVNTINPNSATNAVTITQIAGDPPTPVLGTLPTTITDLMLFADIDGAGKAGKYGISDTLFFPRDMSEETDLPILQYAISEMAKLPQGDDTIVLTP